MNYLLKSNQGNHRGIARKWTILRESEDKQTLIKLLIDIAKDVISDNEILDEDDVKHIKQYQRFSYDLVVYEIVTDKELNKYRKINIVKELV